MVQNNYTFYIFLTLYDTFTNIILGAEMDIFLQYSILPTLNSMKVPPPPPLRPLQRCTSGIAQPPVQDQRVYMGPLTIKFERVTWPFLKIDM